ncbi:hypothetical protein SCP_1801210 [Sparassis crispa]|uniref:Fungal-type protein kinase domain-containing protein n=1 Tax=Sparassis crispa TaxID=139825 RepID=A0A401H6N0_9APHY|nr:hypothetical protein SCP_1801210 [Sparassis crispa]GBE90097.1 hypothetical protein SCP_1801210 [Sparassis crispa]
MNLKESFVDGMFGRVKPDMSWSTMKKVNKQLWFWTLACVEVKRPTKLAFRVRDDVVAVNLSKLRESDSQSTSTIRTRKRKMPKNTNDDVAEPPMKRTRSIYKFGTTSAQERSDRSIYLTNNEVQMTKYQLHMFSHGVRDCVWLLAGWSYHSPMPQYPFLVLAALASADLSCTGISPFVRFTSTTFSSFSTAQFEVPLGATYEGDGVEKKTTERGTTIVPLKTKGETLKLFGRDAVIAKLAWAQTSRTEEGKIIQTA